MMAGKPVPDLGPLEHHLLRILWSMGEAPAREVLARHNAHSRKPLAYTTVMTLLTRMADKGVLAVDRSRQPFIFSPRVSREQILTQRVRDFVDQFFEGSAAELAVRLVEQQPLSDEAVERLESLIRQYRRHKSGRLHSADRHQEEGPA